MTSFNVQFTPPEPCSWSNWRNGIYQCPYCQYKDQRSYLFGEIEAIILDRDAPFGRPNAVIQFSRCPKCKDLSWCHLPLDMMRTMERDLPPELLKIILEERDRRDADAQADWEKSLCKKCKWRKSIRFTNQYPYVHCEGKWGSISGKAQTECDKFKPEPKKKKV